LSEAQRAASLWGKLETGHVPEWLSLDPEIAGPIQVYWMRQ